MCGLAGYLRLTGCPLPFTTDVIHDLHESLRHRGPNGYGTWVSEKAHIALVHRRLSIIDLSDAGSQPMMDQERQIVLVFNGEIYNYQTLRAQLRDLGHTFVSSTDTEVVIEAFKQWGIDCIQRFDGMFAFALFDQRTHDLYLVRDRFGIKPLYFCVQNQIVSFASELKALWHLPWVRTQSNVQAINHYLTYLTIPAPMTMYEEIYKLPAGFYMHCKDNHQISFHRWYDVATAVAQKDAVAVHAYRDQVDTLRTLLRASMAKHMRSDVPMGVFLSGGIDSSLIVALMAEHTDTINTFNVSFGDAPELQERDWARVVSQRFGTRHHELILSEKEAFDAFAQLLQYQDEPLADTVCIPLYAIAHAAKQAGMTVVQIGEGADELFCGYPSYVQYMKAQRWWHMSQHYVPSTLKKNIWHAARAIPLSDGRRELVHNWLHNRPLFFGSALGFGLHKKQSVWRMDNPALHTDPILSMIYPEFVQVESSYDIINYHRARLYKIRPNSDFAQEMMYIELCNRLPELLLMRADAMTMAHSLEARVPFLDHHLVEYAFQLPQQSKYAQGSTKYILKKACEGIVPHDIIYRKKMGFAAPATRWFRSGNYFTAQLQDLLHSADNRYNQLLDTAVLQTMLKTHASAQANYGPQLWAIHTLLSHGSMHYDRSRNAHGTRA